MILCGMLRIFLSPYGGLINVIAQAFGAKEAINFIDSAEAFRTIYIASSIWQGRRLGNHHLSGYPFQRGRIFA